MNLIQLKKIPFLKRATKDIPERPGIYIYWQEKSILYIGKAINLKKRIESYFNLKLLGKTKNMIGKVKSFSYIMVNSELEALLLESDLIKVHQPYYNFISKDDKHPLYIKITRETYPRILTVRKKEDACFGPFPSSNNVKSVLRMLRKIFPYSDHKITRRACLYSHLGLCNPCPSEIVKSTPKEQIMLRKDYLKNIRLIKAVLSRRIKSVINNLEKDMYKESKIQNFEEAERIKMKIDQLLYITQPIVPKDAYLANPNLVEDIRREELNYLKIFLKEYIKFKNLQRIECYDVAHISGTHTTASMAVFIQGNPEKSYYRHFRINNVKKGDDLASLKEIAQRRVRHLSGWGKPNLMIIDGGAGQCKVFFKVMNPFGIPTVAIEKTSESMIIPIKDGENIKYLTKRIPEGPTLNLLQRIRNESHRFAQKYHHILIKKSMTGS